MGRIQVLVAAFAVFALLAFTGPAQSADSLGVHNEQIVTLKGKVVDLACEVTGSCASDCGGGKRPLGLLTEDGRLYVAAKSNTIFAGLLKDIVAQCGKTIIADGLTTSDHDATLLMIQRYKTSDDGAWVETDGFAVDWSKRHAVPVDGKMTEEWYRNDWVVKGAVARRGKLGEN